MYVEAYLLVSMRPIFTRLIFQLTTCSDARVLDLTTRHSLDLHWND